MTKLDADNKILIAELSEFLLTPVIDLDDENFSYLKEILPFWRKKGLAPFIPKGTWVRVSFSDLIWFKIIEILKEFGFTVEQTKVVADCFFKDAYDDDLPKKNLEVNRSELRKKAVAGTISSLENETLQNIESILGDTFQLHALKFKINYLTNLLDAFISTRLDQEIIVFADGTVGKFDGEHYQSLRKKPVDPTKPHIRISIKHLIKEFVCDEDLSEILTPSILNENERKVLEAIRTKNVKEIIITGLDRQQIKIQSKKEGVISGDKVQKIREILGLRNYEDITLKSIDRSSLSFSKTRKK